MTESKTPIADQVRKLEIQRNQVKGNLADIHDHYRLITDEQAQWHLHVISAALPNLVVSGPTMKAILEDAAKLEEDKLADLETKLTTVYAVLEDCLGD